MSNWNWDE